MDVTPIQQTMLALAFFADSNLNQPDGNECADALVSYNTIVSKLAVLNKETGASWKVVWGPAVFSFPVLADPAERHFDNLIYVAQNGTTGDYAVAIAGTDGKSLPDWIFEDAMVGTKVPWLFASTGTPPASISLSTSIGLTALLHIAPCPDIPGTGQKLHSFLASVAQDQAITVYTTGHSLGGALSPTLALALEDMRARWDPNSTATVSPFAFAGATPGDAAFAAYFRSRFPNGMQRIWNGLDIVPHAWDLAHLQEIPTLYGAPAVPDVQKIVDAQVKRVQDKDYAPLDDAQAAFSGPQQSPTPDSLAAFLKEALYQHIEAYMVWGKIDGWNCWSNQPG